MPKNKLIKVIDLTSDISPKTRILSNYSEARLLEARHNIGVTLVKEKSEIEIIFPDTLYVVGSLAFSALFEGSFRRLGEEAFWKKITFVCTDACLHSLQDCVKNLKQTMQVANENTIAAFIDTV